MAELSHYPKTYSLTAVSPSERFTSPGGRVYTNRIGGRHFSLTLNYSNMRGEDAAPLRRDLLRLLNPSTLTTIPTTGSDRAQHLAGYGYLWVDFRKLKEHQSNTPRTVTNIAGSTVTVASNLPTLRDGEVVNLGSEFFHVMGATTTRRFEVWPRPLYTTYRGKVFDPAVATLFGGWFEYVSDRLPEFLQKPSQVPFIGPFSITLQSVTD